MKFKKYSEQQLQEMPLTEVAYLYLTSLKRPVSFNKLTDVVFSTVGVNEEKEAKMGQFYTDLTVDGRFVTFSNGKWGLRYRHRFEAFEWEEEEEDYAKLLEEYPDEDDEDEDGETLIYADEDEDDYDEDEDRIDVSKIVHKQNDTFDDELE